jgi:hypothetical protein
VVQELAFAAIGNFEGWVRNTYNVLPTDPRFRALRPWECKRLYWEAVLRSKIADRMRKQLPAETLADVMQEQDFDARLAEMDEQDKEAAAVRMGPQRPAPMERETLINLKGDAEDHG